MTALVDRYIDSLPEERQALCQALRNLILKTVPEVEEKLSFKIPFYHYFGMFMYLNNTKEGIDVAVCRGKDLLTAFPQLQQKNRASIATVTVTNKKQIIEFELPQLIAVAAEWNKEAKLSGKPFVQKRKRKKNNKGR